MKKIAIENAFSFKVKERHSGLKDIFIDCTDETRIFIERSEPKVAPNPKSKFWDYFHLR